MCSRNVYSQLHLALKMCLGTTVSAALVKYVLAVSHVNKHLLTIM